VGLKNRLGGINGDRDEVAPSIGGDSNSPQEEVIQAPIQVQVAPFEK
jgi:hypothetical protein